MEGIAAGSLLGDLHFNSPMNSECGGATLKIKGAGGCVNLCASA